MVQLDYDEEIGHLLGMYGSTEAEFEVQRTIKMAELTAFLRILKRAVRVHVDNKGIIDGLRRGESKCIKPRTGDADLCLKIWEESHGLAERGIVVEVEHVKAHRTKKEKKDMSHFEKFVTEGNEKADECGGSERKNHAAGKRGSTRSFAERSWLPLLSRTMEGL